MTENELNDEYFNWMIQLVSNDKYVKGLSHNKLFNKLNDTIFYAVIPMDDNRVADGIDLRYRYGYEQRYEDPIIATYLDNKPCSILEMMVALSLRIEESIMGDPDLGDRTGQWFWGMIDSLGLGSMEDSKYDDIYVTDVLTNFLERNYNSNGEGGLFTISNPPKDLRDVEIWYQSCWYLNEIE